MIGWSIIPGPPAFAQVKLGDFGIAHTLEDTFAQAKTQIGTPAYYSPELCKVGLPDITHALPPLFKTSTHPMGPWLVLFRPVDSSLPGI